VSHVAEVTAAINKVGGKVEAFYFSFGGTDVIIVADFPDNVTALAISLTVNANGAAVSTTLLLLPAEVDTGIATYQGVRPPGGP
jgi:uncharacterized protein with GYD domain